MTHSAVTSPRQKPATWCKQAAEWVRIPMTNEDPTTESDFDVSDVPRQDPDPYENRSLLSYEEDERTGRATFYEDCEDRPTAWLTIDTDVVFSRGKVR